MPPCDVLPGCASILPIRVLTTALMSVVFDTVGGDLFCLSFVIFKHVHSTHSLLFLLSLLPFSFLFLLHTTPREIIQTSCFSVLCGFSTAAPMASFFSDQPMIYWLDLSAQLNCQKSLMVRSVSIVFPACSSRKCCLLTVSAMLKA